MPSEENPDAVSLKSGLRTLITTTLMRFLYCAQGSSWIDPRNKDAKQVATQASLKGEIQKA